MKGPGSMGGSGGIRSLGATIFAIFFKIEITPILDGLIFTFLISNFEFLDNAVRIIKKALELISEGIL